VGSPELDNTNFYTMRIATAGVIRVSAEAGITIPLDDNYDELRRQLWLSTDSAYKQALDDFAKKKAALEHRTRTDSAPDLSAEEPMGKTDAAPAIEMSQKDLEATVKSLSAMFKQSPAVDNSLITMTVTNTTLRFLNTEGTWFQRTIPTVSIVMAADTQAPDGMPLADSETIYAGSLAGLPSKDELAARVKALQDRLTKLTQAKLVERYAGPVLFEGEAAAELMYTTLVPQLTRSPRPVVDDQRFEGMFGSDSALAEKKGQRILPSFLSVVDDPTARDFQGKPLWASYSFDEEGVAARRNSLVERGLLKGFLNTRALIAGATKSTGNKRANGVAPSNVIITAEKGLPQSEMKAELIRRVKERGLEFGVLVRKIGDPSTLPNRGRNRVMVFTMSHNGSGGASANGGRGDSVVEAYKVYPDGREELIRNMEMFGLSVGTLKDIVAASDSATVLTRPFRNVRAPMVFTDSSAAAAAMGILQLPPLVSVAAPSVLIDDLTLQRPSGEVPMLPFGKHPFFSKN
jgi:predicted Zn-dependent protease